MNEKIDKLINNILIGDSKEKLKEIPDNSIQLVITSPPYWNAVEYENKEFIGSDSYEKYIEDLSMIWKECERILKPNGKLCINTPILPIPKKLYNKQYTRHIKNINNDIEYSILNNTNLNRYDTYIWEKPGTGLMFGSYPYPGNLYSINKIEYINIFVKEGKPEKKPKELKEKYKITKEEWVDLTNQIWKIHPEIKKRRIHPAPFPELLPARLIKMFSYGRCKKCNYQGDIILDPFVGTGTTLIAAKKLNRNFIGIELSKKYYNIIIEEVKNTKVDLNYNIIINKNNKSSTNKKTLSKQELEKKYKKKKNFYTKEKKKN